jgi:hypothetical protein
VAAVTDSQVLTIAPKIAEHFAHPEFKVFRSGVALDEPTRYAAAPRTRAEAYSRGRVQMIRARARFIGIDPKRATCIAECESKATQCLQAANSECRAAKLMPYPAR